MMGIKQWSKQGGCSLGLFWSWGLACAQVVDLPACEKVWAGDETQVSLGIVQPDASQNLVNYAVKLSLADSRLSVCAESWADVLPRWVPWAGGLERGMGWLVFALAFVVAVTLLWRLTPRDWWRRTTLLGVLGVSAATWVLAVVALFALQTAGAHHLFYDSVVSVRVPKQAGVDWINLKGARDLEAWLASRKLLAPAAAQVSLEAPVAEVTPQVEASAPSGSYVAIHRLNLRSGPGTHHDLLTTIDRGGKVQFDGERQGDWWWVRSSKGIVGWSSSLWLRRPVEVQ